MGNSKSTTDTEQTDCKIWDGAVCAVGIALKNRRHAESDPSPAIASVNFDHVTFSREPVIPIDTEIAIGLLELFYLALHRACGSEAGEANSQQRSQYIFDGGFGTDRGIQWGVFKVRRDISSRISGESADFVVLGKFTYRPPLSLRPYAHSKREGRTIRG